MQRSAVARLRSHACKKARNSPTASSRFSTWCKAPSSAPARRRRAPRSPPSSAFAPPTPPKSTCRRWRARASSSWWAAPRAASACSLTHCARSTRRAASSSSLPLPSLAQLSLPLVGRVAAGSPILAQEHIDQTYLMEASMFPRRPDYLLKVRGMSMRDAGIMDGDLLAVQKAQGRQERPDRRRAARRRRHRQALPAHPHQHRADPREPRLQDHRRAVRRRRFRARRPRRRPDPQQHADVRR